MSITERERTHVDVERERRANVLEAAALEIEVRGWCQGAPCDGEGRVCAMAAVNAVIFAGDGDFNWVDVMETWDSRWRDDWRAYDDNELLPLALWNDEWARDAADVTFVLRWRAAEIRDGR